MADALYHACIFLTVISVAYCTCSNPVITSKSVTTQDATVVTNIAYVSEFSVTCSSGTTLTLYADVEDTIVPVCMAGPNRYQVSWTEDVKTARTGDRHIRVFDEDGYTLLRKALRVGESHESVAPFFNVVVNHPGAFTGPWLKSEFLAAALSVLVAYLAISSRAKLLS